jgi:hypothetical protein
VLETACGSGNLLYLALLALKDLEPRVSIEAEAVGFPTLINASNQRAISTATAAKRLNELRENWLNPADIVKRVPEVVAGYPDRLLPVDAAAAAVLKKRTLTNLYNERPAWRESAHHDLDAAVAAAYVWPKDISEEDALARLLALNHDR